MTASQQMIAFEKVNKWYGDYQALQDISEHVDRGEVVESGTPDEMFNDPKTERLKLFLSQILRGH